MDIRRYLADATGSGQDLVAFMIVLSKQVDVLNTQAYGISEAGRMLHVPKSTVQRWLSGWNSKSGWQPRMLTPIDGRLTFQDLAELSVVQQLRAWKVSVRLIQDFATEIREKSGVERPFLQGVLIDPDGKDLLREVEDQLISTKTRNQALIREAIRTTLVKPERILIEDGAAVRVFPFSRTEREKDPQLVAIDPRHRFGKPVTNPSLIDIDGLVLSLCWGETFQDMASTLKPEKGIPELEEGVRYWLGTMTDGRIKAVDEIRHRRDEIEHRRVEAFREGESVSSIAQRDKIQERTVVKHLGNALEKALAA